MRAAVIKAAVSASTAVLLMAPASSASVPMSADDTHEGVTISVKGRGLHVDRIAVMSGKIRRGERFLVYRHEGTESTMSNVTRWKTARRVSGERYTRASWKIDRRFPDGTWLCAAAKKASGNPCIKVHR
ncbi:hypothetical protein AB0C93_37915 [Streptomyces sp. NPDC048518]|uniref:hypothetical protein n=1 Tax=Streptomyces sp. NPDC048518 TaxID=3155029 RepID=UPI0033EF8258